MLTVLLAATSVCPEIRHAYHHSCCGKSVFARPASPVDCDASYYVNCQDMKATFDTLTACCDDALADRSAEAFCPADGRQLVRHYTKADMRAMPDWFQKDVLSDVDVFRVRAKLTPKVYPEFGNMSFSDTVQAYVYVPTHKRLERTHILSGSFTPFNIKTQDDPNIYENDGGVYFYKSHGAYAKTAATTGVPVIAAFPQGAGYGNTGRATIFPDDPYIQATLTASGVQIGDDLHLVSVSSGLILNFAQYGVYADYHVKSVFSLDPWMVPTGANISNLGDSVIGSNVKAFASGTYDVTPSHFVQNFADYVDPLFGETFTKFIFGNFLLCDLGQSLLTDFAYDRLFSPTAELDDPERYWTTKRHSLVEGWYYWRLTSVMELINEHGIDAVLRPTSKTIYELARPFRDVFMDPSRLGMGADTHIRFYKNTPDSPFTNGEYQQTASELGVGDSDDYHLEYALRTEGYTNVATVNETSIPTFLVDIVTEQRLKELDILRAAGTEMPPCDFPLFGGQCVARLWPPLITDSPEQVRKYESTNSAFEWLAVSDMVHHVLSS